MSTNRLSYWLLVCTAISNVGCPIRGYRDDLDYDYEVAQTLVVEDLGTQEFVQFQSVPIDLIADVGIRNLIVDDKIAAGRKVLHVGCDTGWVALLCIRNDAKSVIATDIQPAAVANTRYNVALIDVDDVKARLRPARKIDAYSTLETSERFDLVLVDLDQEHIDTEAAQVDGELVRGNPVKMLIESLLEGLATRLAPGGRAVVWFHQKSTHQLLVDAAVSRKIQMKSLDAKLFDRKIDELDDEISPAILFELRPPIDTLDGSDGDNSGDSNAQDSETKGEAVSSAISNS